MQRRQGNPPAAYSARDGAGCRVDQQIQYPIPRGNARLNDAHGAFGAAVGSGGFGFGGVPADARGSEVGGICLGS